MTRWSVFIMLVAAYSSGAGVLAQTSSIGAQERRKTKDQPVAKRPREAPPQPRNAVYERHSWSAVAPIPPKTFRPGDLITIIIRERRSWAAEADLERKTRLEISSELEDFIKLTGNGVGASTFRRGAPNIEYRLNQRLISEGDSSRADRLTTRMTGRIIDVKPNGLLVLEGRESITHDDEVATITITGTCRKEDVTADNTILSTQLVDKKVVVVNQGALRSAATRGWILKLLDLVKPF
ncbi:MAG: flagellar basal body L-ring protein FlgH [Planctomycetes bacterium]|nr:flagellar basal body L-ring protein FlgH [Planctomycetota bacterium]